MVRHILSLAELTGQELSNVLGIAAQVKADRKRKPVIPVLSGKKLMAVFEKPSTRTKVSLEVAMFELGGLTVSASSDELQLGRGEVVEDTARTLSRYVDAISARVYSHDKLVAMARVSRVPIINALSDRYHPLQVLADLLTIYEKKGRLAKVKVGWVGDGNNVCNSLVLGASKVGIDMYVATPEGYEPLREAVESARKGAKESGGSITTTHEPTEAVADADVVVTDTFVSMAQESEAEKRLKTFLPKYQVNRELMAKAKRDAIFMHCLPAKREVEVTSEVIDSKRSVVFDEAENRLHTSKAILSYLLATPAQLKQHFPKWPKVK